MTTKFLIAGGVITKKIDGKYFLDELVKGFKEPVRILDVLFSRPRKTWEKVFEEDKVFYKERLNRYFILELAEPEKFAKQVKNSDAIFLRGGNTEKLLEFLKRDLFWVGFLDGKTLAGTSAGAEAIAKYNYDIEKLDIRKGLDLVSIKVIVHFKSENYKVDWGKAVEQLEEYGEKLPVHKLEEGEFIVVEKEL